MCGAGNWCGASHCWGYTLSLSCYSYCPFSSGSSVSQVTRVNLEFAIFLLHPLKELGLQACAKTTASDGLTVWHQSLMSDVTKEVLALSGSELCP